MPKKFQTTSEEIRIEGKLKEVVTLKDEKGHILQRIISPLMVEFRPKDALQVVIGASILAIPVTYTEETWNLGAELALTNIFILLILSLFFVSTFVYYNYYREKLDKHWFEFVKRVASTYVLSFLTVALLLTIIDKAPWQTDWLLAFKRVSLVTFPACMSAAIADTLK